MKGKLLFLGTGGSVGIPSIGCTCPVCTSSDPLNKRLRPSAYIIYQHHRFLIDVGPDFRAQALHHHIIDLDGILLTHAHHDHTAGIDDLRAICYYRHSPLPILLSEETAQDIENRYYYLFKSSGQENFKSYLDLHRLPSPSGEIIFEKVPIGFVSYKQGGMSVNGYRLGDLAYLSDIRQFSPTIFKELEGVRYLIISAMRFTPSHLHFSVDEAIDFAKQLKAEQVWITHISHELEHHHTNAYLPANIRLAYDGLEIEFE